MCDEHSIEDMIKADRTTNEFSRRRFGALTFGAGFISMLPAVANAVEVKESEVQIKTPDGVCDAYFVHPAKGKHPAVLIWPDIFGLRTSFRNMGKRLAESGYSVLVINPFYRKAKAPVVPEGANFQDTAVRTKLFDMMGSLTAETNVIDAKAFIAFLDAQSSVDKKRKMATTGYCMGGPLTMRTAAAFPDRIGAGASFHGGSLVTDKPDSPHLLVPKMKAQYLFAIAENDDKQQPTAKDALREAFAKANLFAEVEVYAGAMHGWCPPDGAAYNHDQAERAWGRMLELFKKALV
jgi:carboxymethylenebutenolidase